jgi:preprotein translocase subunit YajC
MLISPAYAQGTGLFDSQSALVQFLPLVLIFVVFYFLLIRPQQKKQQEHRTMLDALRRGDRVVTGGGIIGTVTDAKDTAELQIEIASGVRVRVIRGTITDVLAKTEPRGDDAADKAEKAEKTK